VLLPALLIASAVAAGAQTLDDVIARNLQAKGGAEMLKSTNSVRMTATLASPGQPGDITITMLLKRPNLMRREMAMGGRTMVFGFDGATAWARQGDGPAEPVTGPQADQLKQSAEFDSVFLNYKELGHTIELVGQESSGGKPVYHVKVTRKEGPVQHYYLDAETGLEQKMVMEMDQGGMKVTVETQLSDYRTVDGRVLPYKIRQLANGAPAAEITTEKVEFNVPVDEAVFKMPTAK
jgi:outer membrane lipoprotein-sorting protein